MKTGTLKWYNFGRGFGFVVPSDGSGDVMIHISAVDLTKMRRINQTGLPDGKQIEYEIDHEYPRPRAKWWRPS